MELLGLIVVLAVIVGVVVYARKRGHEDKTPQAGAGGGKPGPRPDTDKV